MRKCHNCEADVSEKAVFCPSCDVALLPPGAAPPKRKSQPRKKAKAKTALEIYDDHDRADTCTQCKKRTVAPGETICLECSGAKSTDLGGNLKPVPPPKR